MTSKNSFENLTGRKYGGLIVLGKGYRPGYRTELFWICRCDCGRMCYATSHQLTTGLKWHCGCLTHGRGHQRIVQDPSEIRFATLIPTDKEGYVTVNRRPQRKRRKTQQYVLTQQQALLLHHPHQHKLVGVPMTGQDLLPEPESDYEYERRLGVNGPEPEVQPQSVVSEQQQQLPESNIREESNTLEVVAIVAVVVVVFNNGACVCVREEVKNDGKENAAA